MKVRIAIILAVVGLAPAAAPAADSPPRFDTGGLSESKGTSNVKPKELENVGIDQKLDVQLPPDLPFIDETGQPVTLGKYFGGQRPLILTFVQYRCPRLCNLVLNDECRALNATAMEPGRDYDLLTISFDPRESTELAAAKKRVYDSQINRPGVHESWRFLTGSADSIKKVTDAAGFRYVYDAKNDQYIHASGIMVLTPEGRMSKYFYGIEYAPNDLRLAVAEAGQGRVGSLSDAVLVYCFHYDPITGKYTLAVRNLLRVAGGLTVLALAAFMGLHFIRDRTRAVTNLGAYPVKSRDESRDDARGGGG